LAQSRTAGSAQLVEFLASALNKNIVPAFTSNASSGNELVEFVAGNGLCYAAQKDELVECAQIFAASGLSAVVLSAEAEQDVRSYPFLAIGAGCMAAAAALSIVRVVDCVTSLSCEASGCSAEGFDAAIFEVGKPHRGQMQSASNLRLLLDGSKRVNTCPKEPRAALQGVQSSPQTTGPCRDIILAAAK
jgi:histidine ammonia-lyase